MTACTICVEDFDRSRHKPQVLPCIHRYCSACLKRLFEDTGGSHVECPECKTQHRVDPDTLPVVNISPNNTETNSTTPSTQRQQPVDIQTLFNSENLAENTANCISNSTNSILWEIQDVSQKRNRNLRIESPIFSTGDPGYDLKFDLYLDGNQDGAGNFVSLYLKICRSLTDEHLDWPFPHTIIFGIVDLTDANSCRSFCTFNFRGDQKTNPVGYLRPEDRENSGVGRSRLMSHEEAFSDICTCNDSLFIRAHFLERDYVVDLSPSLQELLGISADSVLQWDEDNLVTKKDPFVVWVIENVTEKRLFPNAIVSPTFMIDNWGYRLRMMVHLNGTSSARDSHLSLFMNLCPSEVDDHLDWPFPFSFVFGPMKMFQVGSHGVLFSIHEDGRKYPKAFRKPEVSGYYGVGQDKLIPLSEVYSEEYLLNDRLFIKAIANDL